MSKITFTDDAGNTQDVTLPEGIALTVAAPVPVPPPVPIITGQALTADKTEIHVGDTFTVSGVLDYNVGPSKPVTAYRLYGFDKTVVATPQSFARTFTAIAAGTTTIANDNSGTTGKLTVTVLPAAQQTPPSDPPDDTLPTLPTDPLPPAPTGVHTVRASTVINQVLWTAIATVGEDPTVMGDYYHKFTDPDGNAHPCMRLLAWADCCEVGAVNGRSGMGYTGSLRIEYDNDVVWDGAQVLFFCGTLNQTIRYGKFQPQWKPVPDGLFPNYAKPASPLRVDLQKYDWSYNGAGYCSVLAQQTTGMRSEICPVPPPDIPFLLDPSDDTYAWVRKVADNDGAWPIARLDDDTGLPFDITKYPNATLMGSPLFAGNPIAPRVKGDNIPACPTTWDEAHHTGYGFVAAAATGSARDRLHAAVLANATLTAFNPSYRQQCGVWAHYQERGSAWALRSIFFASRVSCMTDYFAAQLDIQRQQGERQITNAMGMQGTYINRTFPDGSTGTAQWEENFTRTVLGLIAANESAWETLRARMAKGLSIFMAGPQYQLATLYTLAWRNADGSDKTSLADILASSLTGWSADDIATAISPSVTTTQMSALIAKYQAGWAGKVGDFAQYVAGTDDYPAIVRAATASNFAADSTEWETCDGVPTKPAFSDSSWQWNLVPRAA